MRFYFGESLRDMTMPVLQARIAFLCGGDAESSDGGSVGGQRLAAAAQAVMSKSGRKSIPLHELIGVM